MRVLIAECKQEVSTFNPSPTGYDDFVYSRGDDIARFHAGVDSEIGGALRVFAEAGVETVGALSARAITSGGTLAGDAWNRIAGEFLDGVADAWKSGPIDGIYFSMHGAMCAASDSDPEGYLLQETRRIVGEAVPIVLSLDLHGIVTDRMLTHSDALAAYRTYPHNDFSSTGERAARLLLRIVRGEINPVTAIVRIPALVRGDELITVTGLIGNRIRECEAFEAAGGVSGNMFWGNPFTDVPQLCSYSLMISNNDEVLAIDAATRVAKAFWTDRAAMQAPLVSIEEAVGRAGQVLEEGRGTVVLIDAADATSSGASGDSNAILRGLIELGYRGRVLFPIVDAPAVEQAMAAGIGSSVHLRLGGTLDPARFEPLPVEARVRLLCDGRFISESHGIEWFAGPTAVLEVGRHIVVATSRPVSLYDRSLFYATGQDPRRFDVVVQKSPHCRHEFFAAWAAELIGVDALGSTSANLPYLGHTVCSRPMYPMEQDVEFTPVARVFRRQRR